MARQKIRLPDQIRRTNGSVADAQIADRITARFLGIIRKIGLNRLVGMLRNQANGAFVSTYRAVRPNAEKFATYAFLFRQDECFIHRQGEMRYIILNANGEMFATCAGVQEIQRGFHLRRGKFLATQPVATAADAHASPRSLYRRADIQIQRLSQRTGFLRAIQHRQRTGAFRQGTQQHLRRERAKKSHLHYADLFPLQAQRADGFRCRLRAGTHQEQHAFRIRCAGVIKQLHRPSRHAPYLLHALLHRLRHRQIAGISRFPSLKVYVRILARSLLMWMLRIHAACPKLPQPLPRHQRLQLFRRQHLKALDFMARAESVKKMQHRHAAFQRRQMCHHGQIRRFLHRSGA